MEGVPERFTAFKRRVSGLQPRRSSLLRPEAPHVTPMEGVPETFSTSWMPRRERAIPIRRLPGPSPAPASVRPAALCCAR